MLLLLLLLLLLLRLDVLGVLVLSTSHASARFNALLFRRSEHGPTFPLMIHQVTWGQAESCCFWTCGMAMELELELIQTQMA